MNAPSLIDVSRRLLEAPGDEYVAAAAEQLQRLLGADEVLWMQPSSTGTSAVWRASTLQRDAHFEDLMPAMFALPTIQSYLRAPGDLAPRRCTDFGGATDDAGASALEVSRRVCGPYQLSVMIETQGPRAGTGWVIERDGRDFDDAEVEAATRVQPLLYVFDAVRRPDVTRQLPEAPPADGWLALTDRERQVADLLGSGMTVHAMGHILGISHRTVSKHLENIYRKLDRHDRLLVALEGKRVELLA